jgi:serine/threonine protein kinase
MILQEMNWIGMTVGDFEIESLIGEGSFSWVYRGRHADGVTGKAFKVAKPHEYVRALPGDSQTAAFFLQVGHVSRFNPDAAALLALQAERVRGIQDASLVSIDFVKGTEAVCYCQMELVEGLTLRQLMNRGPLPVQVFIELARCLQRLSENQSFEYHGNLTPDNILVTESEIKLVDPGYWGMIDSYNGTIPSCAVTTPAYYPSLLPDDLLALGLLIWEAAMGQSLLGAAGDSEGMDLTRVGEDLLERVMLNENIGKFFLSPILELYTPSQLRMDMPDALETFLLRALRLRVRPDGILDADSGFASFGEIAGALMTLQDQDIDDLGKITPEMDA